MPTNVAAPFTAVGASCTGELLWFRSPRGRRQDRLRRRGGRCRGRQADDRGRRLRCWQLLPSGPRASRRGFTGGLGSSRGRTADAQAHRDGAAEHRRRLRHRPACDRAQLHPGWNRCLDRGRRHGLGGRPRTTTPGPTNRLRTTCCTHASKSPVADPVLGQCQWRARCCPGREQWR